MNKKMKSKSFDLKQSPNEKGKNNKTFDFVGLYKSAAESNSILSGKTILAEGQKDDSKTMNITPKRERSPNKNKKKNKNELVELAQINIDGSNLNSHLGSSTPLIETKVTPNSSAKSKSLVGRVKSIMKSKPVNGDDSMDGSQLEVSSISSTNTKSKKRNKSVSFMLDDNEEVVIKKTKSNESLKVNKKNKVAKEHVKEDRKKLKKMNKNQQSEKENNASDNNNHMETDVTSANQLINKKINKKKSLLGDAKDVADSQNSNLIEKKKKFKKEKKQKTLDSSEAVTAEPSENVTTEGTQDVKNKKTKKKKRQAKSQTDSTETGEPAMKSRKKDVKPELIAEDLENLSIGDNAHTLTNLLDEMKVVDKVKLKRLRQKLNRAKKHIPSSETGGLELAEGEKEKVKWKKRKWNKDKKGDINEDLATTVIVEGLPLSIMLNYKTLLSEYFEKLGLIKKIGIAEVYPTEESRPVFTTTITFNSDGAAQLALDEDNSTFEGARIRVKRPLPPTETTLVLRTYGDITPQAVGQLLTGAGKIRNIRHLVKGKKAMSSVFIEFDGPESVQRAIKLAEDAKIGGKKIHVSKFEIRKSKQEKKPKTTAESDGEESDDSN